MNAAIVTEPKAKSNSRFVPPLSEYEMGRQLYRQGKCLAECIGDSEADGWLDAEAAGADAYYRCMMAEAVN